MKNRVVNNASWIIASRIIQALLSLVISMLTARYLGPSEYGLINYAASMVAFVVPIMHLGINSVLVQEIIKNPNEESTYVGTATGLSMFSAILCMIGITGFVSIINKGEKDTIIVCVLYSILLIFQSFEMLQYWFQAKYLSKYTSIVALVAYVIVSMYKIYLLATNKSVYWFALSNAIDYLVIAIGTYSVFHKFTNQKLHFSIKVAKKLLNVGKYYILSDLMVTVFGQTDRIMLKAMVNNEATGYYSAAITCAGITQFVFGAILDSARPAILENKGINEEKYERNMSCLYGIVIYLSLLQSIFMTILSSIIIQILYGNAYDPAISALKIIVWYTTFSYLGAARNIWILGEEKQRYLIPINFMGAVANIFLNLVFIPIWGINGAAFASLITQIFTNIVTGFILSEIRKTNFLMLRGLSPKFMIRTIKSLLN